MTGDPLFFVAIVIPEPIAVEIRAFQEYASVHFQSGAALRSPPHITLVAPFAASEDSRKLLFDTLTEQSHLSEPIEISLDGFDVFGKRVIFINVESSPLLEKLSKDLHQILMQHGFKLRDERRPYHPHVTVAFKDLRPEMFDDAAAHFQGIAFHLKFHAFGIELLEFVNGSWQVMREH